MKQSKGRDWRGIQRPKRSGLAGLERRGLQEAGKDWRGGDCTTRVRIETEKRGRKGLESPGWLGVERRDKAGGAWIGLDWRAAQRTGLHGMGKSKEGETPLFYINCCAKCAKSLKNLKSSISIVLKTKRLAIKIAGRPKHELNKTI